MKTMPYNAPELDIIKFEYDEGDDVLNSSIPVQESYEFPIMTRQGN